MRTVAVVSQKGGAGKTTLALHIAVAAERAGYSTVLIDMDPQGTALSPFMAPSITSRAVS